MCWRRLHPRRLHRRWSGEHAQTDASVDSLAEARARMVSQQLEARGVHDPELLAAFSTVARHHFVDADDAYSDRALPLSAGQTISQPYVVAAMTVAARPPEGWRGAAVLEVGTGSGYQAAILAEMGAEVVSIERHAELADGARRRLAAAGYASVQVVVGDGTLGWPVGAPYRSIVVTAAGPSVPQPLLKQLDPNGGRLVMPVGSRISQVLTRVVRDGDHLDSRQLESVVFVPLIGRFGFPAE